MYLRPAEPSDIEEILKMYRNVHDETLLANSLDYCLKRSIGNDRMMLALVDERPVGFLWSRLSTDPESGKRVDKVKLLVIASDMYGKGIGGLLLKAEQEFAREKHARLLKMNAKPEFSE